MAELLKAEVTVFIRMKAEDAVLDSDLGHKLIEQLDYEFRPNMAGIEILGTEIIDYMIEEAGEIS